MNKLVAIALVVFFGKVSVLFAEHGHMDVVREILLVCRSPEDPTPNDDLVDYARQTGLSDEDVSMMLIELVQDGLNGNLDVLQRQLTEGALWSLSHFGAERENEFVRTVMLSTQDSGLRQVCVRVGIRMMPEKWEEWVRATATDNRFDDLTRFDAYEEAYRVGMNGDENTRQQVEKVLSEFMERETTSGNSISMQRWANELKAR